MKKRNVLLALISRMDSGEDVSRRRLFRAIGSTALAGMERVWREEVQSRGYKPREITEYARRLGIALRKYGKADLYSVRGSVKARRLFEVAEADFENALEYLIDVVQRQPDLRMWIDRDVGFDNAHIELHPIGMPYPIWSKSSYARKGTKPKRTIRDFKREALEEALTKLERCVKPLEVPTFELSFLELSSARKMLQKNGYSSWKF
jgi:hypothetical protein